MKKTKILVPALSVLALGMAAAVTGTVAWFSANNIVTSNGMKFNSVTPSSLAISKTLATDGIGQATTITWEDDAQAVNPVSHWHGSEDSTGVYWTVTNGEYIDPVTGLAALNDVNGENQNAANTTYTAYENITFGSVSGDDYYVDYECFIGSVGAAIVIGTGGYLRATPTITSPGSYNDTIHAATVDFFVYKQATNDAGTMVDGAETYVQGVNEIKKDYTQGRHATYVGEVEELGNEAKTYSDVLVAGDTIPTASGNKAIKVVMRFYFDGALLKDTGNAYVATNRLDTSDINVNVSFSLNRGN